MSSQEKMKGGGGGGRGSIKFVFVQSFFVCCRMPVSRQNPQRFIIELDLGHYRLKNPRTFQTLGFVRGV